MNSQAFKISGTAFLTDQVGNVTQKLACMPYRSQLSDGNLLIFAPSEDILLGKDESVDNNGVWNVFFKGELLGTYEGNLLLQGQRKWICIPSKKL